MIFEGQTYHCVYNSLLLKLISDTQYIIIIIGSAMIALIGLAAVIIYRIVSAKRRGQR